eukprot:ctg_1775.g506
MAQGRVRQTPHRTVGENVQAPSGTASCKRVQRSYPPQRRALTAVLRSAPDTRLRAYLRTSVLALCEGASSIDRSRAAITDPDLQRTQAHPQTAERGTRGRDSSDAGTVARAVGSLGDAWSLGSAALRATPEATTSAAAARCGGRAFLLMVSSGAGGAPTRHRSEGDAFPAATKKRSQVGSAVRWLFRPLGVVVRAVDSKVDALTAMVSMYKAELAATSAARISDTHPSTFVGAAAQHPMSADRASAEAPKEIHRGPLAAPPAALSMDDDAEAPRLGAVMDGVGATTAIKGAQAHAGAHRNAAGKVRGVPLVADEPRAGAVVVFCGAGTGDHHDDRRGGASGRLRHLPVAGRVHHRRRRGRCPRVCYRPAAAPLLHGAPVRPTGRTAHPRAVHGGGQHLVLPVDVPAGVVDPKVGQPETHPTGHARSGLLLRCRRQRRLLLGRVRLAVDARASVSLPRHPAHPLVACGDAQAVSDRQPQRDVYRVLGGVSRQPQPHRLCDAGERDPHQPRYHHRQRRGVGVHRAADPLRAAGDRVHRVRAAAHSATPLPRELRDQPATTARLPHIPVCDGAERGGGHGELAAAVHSVAQQHRIRAVRAEPLARRRSGERVQLWQRRVLYRRRRFRAHLHLQLHLRAERHAAGGHRHHGAAVFAAVDAAGAATLALLSGHPGGGFRAHLYALLLHRAGAAVHSDAARPRSGAPVDGDSGRDRIADGVSAPAAGAGHRGAPSAPGHRPPAAAAVGPGHSAAAAAAAASATTRACRRAASHPADAGCTGDHPRRRAAPPASLCVLCGHHGAAVELGGGHVRLSSRRAVSMSHRRCTPHRQRGHHAIRRRQRHLRAGGVRCRPHCGGVSGHALAQEPARRPESHHGADALRRRCARRRDRRQRARLSGMASAAHRQPSGRTGVGRCAERAAVALAGRRSAGACRLFPDVSTGVQATGATSDAAGDGVTAADLPHRPFAGRRAGQPGGAASGGASATGTHVAAADHVRGAQSGRCGVCPAVGLSGAGAFPGDQLGRFRAAAAGGAPRLWLSV